MEFTVTRYWKRGLDRTPHVCHTTFLHAPGDERARALPRAVRHVAGACAVEPNLWLATIVSGDPPPPTRDVIGITREEYVEMGGQL